MFVVTTAAGQERAGCLVGFVTQTSIIPPRVLVCLSRGNHTTRVAARAEWLAVHVLRAGDHELARVFGEITETDDGADKLRRVPWRPGPGGVPLLDGIDCVVGRVTVRIPYLGDHVGHLLAVDDAHTITEPTRSSLHQLGYQQVRDLDAGIPPGSTA
jgi:flavin reductase (DIM6/NTAB) family NADH-FMN oxidoreductase RutF